MKTLKYFLIAFLISFSCVYNQNTPGNSSSNKIKVLTFNIRYGTANDGENSWQFRKDLLFELLKEEKADIIGLQEALKPQLEEIKNILPQFEQLGVGREDGKTAGEYSAILYRKDRLKPDSSGYFWFSDKPQEPGSMTWGNKVTRICTWVLLNDSRTNKKFYFYNLHIDHESQNSRVKSIEQLLSHINKNNYPVIVTGDFNAGEDNQAVKHMLSGGLADSFRKLFPYEKNVNTYHAFKGGTTGDKIDYVFCSKSFRVIEASIIRKNKDGKYPSDHFPVNAVLEF